MRNRVIRCAGILCVVLASGCAHVAMPNRATLSDHVEYMNRAARAEGPVRESMKRKAEKLADESPDRSKLRLGLLLTSPNADPSETREGVQMLESLLHNSPELTPGLKDLVELRLREVAARRRLQKEVRDVQTKIEKLMSIESDMEDSQEDSGSRGK